MHCILAQRFSATATISSTGLGSFPRVQSPQLHAQAGHSPPRLSGGRDEMNPAPQRCALPISQRVRAAMERHAGD